MTTSNTLSYSSVHLEALGYELAPVVVTSQELERRLEPVYRTVGMNPGSLEALTGIVERRMWQPGFAMWDGALRAARKAMATAGVAPEDIGMVVYGGVCRDQLEPATACAVADGLGLGGDTEILDISNACLGVLNGIIHAANAIELGQVRAALVVSCESSRAIVDWTIERLVERCGDMETFRKSLATLTGGSGAVAVVLAHRSIATAGRRLLGGVIRSEARHHRLCRWTWETQDGAPRPQLMETDAPEVLRHGIALGLRTWRDFLNAMRWTRERVDKVICHQVGEGHRIGVLQALGVPVERDFATFPFLGNIGTVSLPITAAIAEERGFLQPGDRVGFLGIGSGLNCLMLGVEW